MKNRAIDAIIWSGIFAVLFFLPGSAPASEKPEIFVQMGHTHNVTSVAFSPDGKYALSGSIDKTAKLWDVATGREIRTFSGPRSRITTVAFIPNGRHMISGDEDITNNIKLWDIESGKQIRTYPGHEAIHGIVSATVTPDGRYVIAGCEGNRQLFPAEGKIQL